jgi:hypothetical protein
LRADRLVTHCVGDRRFSGSGIEQASDQVLISGRTAARSASVSSMNTRGMHTAMRVSNRKTSLMPSGTAPSQSVAASK